MIAIFGVTADGVGNSNRCADSLRGGVERNDVGDAVGRRHRSGPGKVNVAPVRGHHRLEGFNAEGDRVTDGCVGRRINYRNGAVCGIADIHVVGTVPVGGRRLGRLEILQQERSLSQGFCPVVDDAVGCGGHAVAVDGEAAADEPPAPPAAGAWLVVWPPAAGLADAVW